MNSVELQSEAPVHFKPVDGGNIEPDSDFTEWLKGHARSVGVEMRVRFNPQRKRWVIDERNKQTRMWQCILVWETDDGRYLDLNRDLALRLQLNAWKYKQLIISPSEYLSRIQRQADAQMENQQKFAEEEAAYVLMQNPKAINQISHGFLKHEHDQEKKKWKIYNRKFKI